MTLNLDDMLPFQCTQIESKILNPAIILADWSKHVRISGFFCCQLCSITNSTGLCAQGALRLQDGTGIIEICDNDDWGKVCADSWTPVEVKVACIQLGLPNAGML